MPHPHWHSPVVSHSFQSFQKRAPPTVDVLDDRDSRIFYSGNWVKLGSSNEYDGTTSQGNSEGKSKATLKFRATSIRVIGTYGWTHADEGLCVSSYQVDARPAIEFTQPQLTTSRYKQTLFDSSRQGELSRDEEHTIVITYIKGTRLYLDAIELTTTNPDPPPPDQPETTSLVTQTVTERETITGKVTEAPTASITTSSFTSSSTSSSTSKAQSHPGSLVSTSSTMTATPTTRGESSLGSEGGTSALPPSGSQVAESGGLASNSRPNIAGIAGGVVGGVVLLLVCLLLFLRHRKRSKPVLTPSSFEPSQGHRPTFIPQYTASVTQYTPSATDSVAFSDSKRPPSMPPLVPDAPPAYS